MMKTGTLAVTSSAGSWRPCRLLEDVNNWDSLYFPNKVAPILKIYGLQNWYHGSLRHRLAFVIIYDAVSQAEALWESKSQIAGLAYQDIRYKGLVYQTARQNNNNQSTRNFITTRGYPLVQHAGVLGLLMSLELPHGLSGELEAFQSWGTSSRRAHPRFRKHHHFSMRLLHRHGTDR
jgi:hypothetical protein